MDLLPGKISWPLLGLTFTKDRVKGFHDGCYAQDSWCLPFMGTWSHSCFIKEFVDSNPLFLLISFCLLVCFKFMLSLWTMHFRSLTLVFYTGLTYSALMESLRSLPKYSMIQTNVSQRIYIIFQHKFEMFKNEIRLFYHDSLTVNI